MRLASAGQHCRSGRADIIDPLRRWRNALRRQSVDTWRQVDAGGSSLRPDRATISLSPLTQNTIGDAARCASMLPHPAPRDGIGFQPLRAAISLNQHDHALQ